MPPLPSDDITESVALVQSRKICALLSNIWVEDQVHKTMCLCTMVNTALPWKGQVVGGHFAKTEKKMQENVIVKEITCQAGMDWFKNFKKISRLCDTA